MLADEITGDLRAIRAAAVDEATRRGSPVTRRLTSKGIDYGGTTSARPSTSGTSTGPSRRHQSSRAQALVIEFLESFVLFPPDDTASDLDSGDPSARDFPQWHHGSINLSVLFNDPGDRE